MATNYAALGIHPTSTVNKFGRTTNADQNIATDVHDGANATDDVDVWVAPTTARTHSVVSTDVNDTAAGSGATSFVVYGLTAWDAPEVVEVLASDGTTPVVTTNSYVIIHRIQALGNAGVITATATTDGTVTAQVNVGEGQTQMAIYGVPSGKTLYLTNYYASAIKPAAAVTASVALLVNPAPSTSLTKFAVKHTNSLDTAASNYFQHTWYPRYPVPGPAIIKIQVSASANNTDISAGFDGILL